MGCDGKFTVGIGSEGKGRQVSIGHDWGSAGEWLVGGGAKKAMAPQTLRAV